MSARTIAMTDHLYSYYRDVTVHEPEILQRLRGETADLGGVSTMQISPEQGQFMALLVELLGVQRLLEVGTFTGYSSLACALAMPADGHIFCCDVSPDWTAVAKRYWQEAGVADRIVLKLAPALETLDELLARGGADSFDMAFIDADKGNYANYFDRTLRLVRPGGLICFDNTLWNGRVADPDDMTTDTVAIRALNALIANDDRVTASLVPIGDGLTLARRR